VLIDAAGLSWLLDKIDESNDRAVTYRVLSEDGGSEDGDEEGGAHID
jgi:hypothetical protein